MLASTMFMSGLCVQNTELTNLPLLILYRRSQSWPRTLTYLCIRSERRHCCLSLVMFGLRQPFRADSQAPAFKRVVHDPNKAVSPLVGEAKTSGNRCIWISARRRFVCIGRIFRSFPRIHTGRATFTASGVPVLDMTLLSVLAYEVVDSGFPVEAHQFDYGTAALSPTRWHSRASFEQSSVRVS